MTNRRIPDTADGFGLSPQQRHLWRLHQADGGTAYVTQCAVRIEGPWREETLRAALKDVIQSHEILRTRYVRPAPADLPEQVIDESADLCLDEHRLPAGDARSFEATCDEVLKRLVHEPRDLSDRPLLAFSLVTDGSGRSALLISVPALSMDAPGLDRLVGQISRAYEARSRNQQSADDPLQYADLAEWQNELLEGDETAAGRAFWKDLDLAVVRDTKLPPFPRPSADSSRFSPRQVAVTLGAGDSQRVLAISREHGVPVSVGLLTAWQILLGRLTGQSEVVIAVASDGRNHEDLADSLGLFERFLPLRLGFDDSLRFVDVLQKIGNSAERAAKRQGYFSWELLTGADESRPEPFCPIGFDFSLQPPRRTAGDVTFAIDELNACTDRFAIQLSCIRNEGAIAVRLRFDPDRYEADDIRRLGAQFSTLLGSALDQPDLPISELVFLSNQEREEIARWNDGERIAFPEEACLHELIEQHAVESPDCIAVVQGTQQVTYQQLNASANQLARYLREHGVDRETLVGISVHRSVEMAVALLAIAKAGGAYLPMDPAYPPERLRYMLDDSHVPVLLTQQRLVDSIPASDATIIAVDAADAEYRRHLTTNPATGVTFDNLSYVIYTSGSTGKPKGVMLNHQGRVNNFLDFNRRFSIGRGDRIIALASLSFDMCAYDMFGTLAAGATIVMPLPEEMQEPRAWAKRINNHMVSIWHTAPAMLQMLVDHLESHPAEAPRSLRLALLGGDWIPVTQPDRLRSLVETLQFISMGGATECSMDSTIYEVLDVDPNWKSIPYGQPMKNQRSYVLDAEFDELPFGVPGELYLGGIGVGRGYFRRPEFTAQRFVPDPYVDQPGARMYRTGDLAQWMPDGNLELLGRMDHQVKIRGYRIELGEIESALRHHEDVRQVVVVARDAERGDKMLVAYVVPERNSADLQQQLRALAKEKLPDYMVPSAYVRLDSLPLTPNGKVDRRSLPAPEAVRPDLEARFVEPRTEAEAKLAKIWSEVLHVERVGAEDNFFELGGHSLLATQVISRIRTAFDIDLPLRSLFEAPTVGGLAKLVQAATGASDVQIPRRVAASDQSEPPLSFAQERLWFLDQLTPGSSAYNIPYAGRFLGPLKTDALDQLLREIGRRHEVLRTRFPMVNGRPHQEIEEADGVRLRYVDMDGLPAGERLTQCRRLAAEEGRRSFDLAKGPLARGTLLRLDHQDHAILMTMHHAVSDGWSLKVLTGELSALYAAFGLGRPSQLPELPIQYADYAVWQRQWLDARAIEAQLSYWKRQLVGAPPSLELPMDRPRPAVQTFRGANESILLSEELTGELKALSQREGATLFMTLMAAFQTLLHRYTGEQDVLVGTPIAGRNRSEMEGLIGFFVNTLVMRADLSGDPTFRSLLREVRETALEAYAHQDLPFETLVDKLDVERDLSRTPLFQVVFSLDSETPQTLDLSELKYQPLATENQTAKFDLVFNLSEQTGALSGSLEYNTDLFDRATMQRMLGHFQTLLEGIVANPEQRVSALPLMALREREQLLVEWNATGAAVSGAGCIHELFEAQAEARPDAVAVTFEGRVLSYRELNARANQLARHLRELGVGPDVPVGILMERSSAMLEAMLGVLKAGGAYLPLDPNAPSDRLQFMIADAAVRVVLTLESLRSNLPQGAQVVCLDRDWSTISPQGNVNLASRVDEANLAYVIYTSGSTGRPKGVGVPHGGLCNLVAWHRKTFGLTPSSRATQIAAPTFDASVWEIWPHMAAGSSLHIPDEVTRSSPPDLAAWLTTENVTHTFMPTPLAEEVLQERWPTQTSLEFFLTGGDELRRVPKQILPFRLTNQYGPTENTVVATWTPVENSGSVEKPPPIGRPIDNVRVYVLDQQLNPVPIGVNGELYIGGSSLSRGYVSRPDLTAERFIPDFSDATPGSRLYRTGDLCRFSPEGDLEFRGRRDHQVKLRGFRIELGEIEAALTVHPVIRDAVVVVRADGTAGQPVKRLVAYVVVERQPGPSTEELRSHLKERLPDYMVPAAFVTLDALPLTPNGKLDRRALPALDLTRPELGDPFVLPRSETERTLGEIWSQVLRVERIGIHDNFFELGGDSILSIQIVSKANQAGLRLTPRDIFQHQTIAELAGSAGLAPAIDAEQHLVSGPVPLTPIQRWFFDLGQIDPSHFNQAVLLEVKQDLDPRVLSEAVESLMLHHDALRLRFEKDGATWRQTGTDPGHMVPFRSIDLSDLAPEERRPALERTAAELQGSLDLSDGPLLQVALFDLGPGEHQRLLIVAHHLVVDGVSWRILLEDLQTAFDQLRQGRRAQLPAKTTSFARWAERLLEHAGSPAVEAESPLWSGLRRATVEPLPVDFENGENSGASSESVAVSLGVEETEALLKKIPEVYHTQINDVLLTAVVQAFTSWTGNGSLLLALEGHGREPLFEDVDVSRTIGWFTTIYPVCLHVEPDDSPGDALKSIKEQLRAVPNRGVNYGVLRYLKDSGDVADRADSLLGLDPPEVSFNYLGQFDQSLAADSKFSLARESSGPPHSPRNKRPWLLQVDGYVQEDQLRLVFAFSRNVHRRVTIERLSREVLRSLQALISHCLSPDAGGFTPSDFPLARLDVNKLGRLAEKLAAADARKQN